MWFYYTDKKKRELREHMDGWVELKHQQEWISVWEYPRYFVPGRSFTKKQSEEDCTREFYIVRKDVLLLELIIRGAKTSDAAPLQESEQTNI